MRSIYLGAWLLLAPTTAQAAIIASGTVVSGGFINFTIGAQAGAHYRVELALDKPAGTVSGEYDIDYRTSDCAVNPTRPECAPNDATESYRVVRVSDLLYAIDFQIPAIGSRIPRYLYAVRDFGGYFSPRATADTAGNYPLSYTVSVAAVPEPASWALMIGGFALAGTAWRRRGAVAVAPTA